MRAIIATPLLGLLLSICGQPAAARDLSVYCYVQNGGV